MDFQLQQSGIEGCGVSRENIAGGHAHHQNPAVTYAHVTVMPFLDRLDLRESV